MNIDTISKLIETAIFAERHMDDHGDMTSVMLYVYFAGTYHGHDIDAIRFIALRFIALDFADALEGIEPTPARKGNA